MAFGQRRRWKYSPLNCDFLAVKYKPKREMFDTAVRDKHLWSSINAKNYCGMLAVASGG